MTEKSPVIDAMDLFSSEYPVKFVITPERIETWELMLANHRRNHPGCEPAPGLAARGLGARWTSAPAVAISRSKTGVVGAVESKVDRGRPGVD